MKKIDIKDLAIDVLIPVASGTIIGIVLKDYTSSIEKFNRNIIQHKDAFVKCVMNLCALY